MKYKKLVCIVVDGYSTGKLIAPALISKGYDCIHIQSSAKLPKEITCSHKDQNYVKNFIFNDDIDFIIDELKDWQVKMCVSGSESGVELADELSEKLNLNGNGTLLSKTRRNKFQMIERIKLQGLKTTEHLVADNLAEVINWSKKFGYYPVVLKPLESASGDGVHICKDQSEIENSFNSIIKGQNLFGVHNSKVLAEQYIDGEEYIINTVSSHGLHYLVEIWHIIRVPQTTIYDKCELIDTSDEKYTSLKAYTFSVLNALGIKFGAGTTEVRFTTNGPVVIESASRLMGGAELAITRESVGHDQLSLMLEAYLNPENFLKRIGNDNYKLTISVVAVLLISNMDGKLQRELDASFLFKSINSLFSFYIDVKKDDLIKKTDSLLTSPGTIYLMGAKEIVSHDVQQIRSYEKSYLYLNAIENQEDDKKVNEIQKKSAKPIKIISSALFALSLFSHSAKNQKLRQSALLSSIASLGFSIYDTFLSSKNVKNLAHLKMAFNFIGKGIFINSLKSGNKKLSLSSAFLIWFCTTIVENLEVHRDKSSQGLKTVSI